SQPKPIQKPGVPIVVGGHAKSAARRAARLGDGYFPGRSKPEDLNELIGVMRNECNKIGRNPDEIEISAGAQKPDLDNVKRLEDLGIRRVMIGPPAFDPDGVRAGLHAFADKVITKI